MRNRPGQLMALGMTDSLDTLGSLGFAIPPIVGNTMLEPDRPAMCAAIDGIAELDGLVLDDPTPPSDDRHGDPAVHPNRVSSIDHVVVMTPNADRTREAFVAAGLDPRRERRFETPKGTMRQTFHWLGDVVCEVVGDDDGDGDGPATWWGLALVCDDLDATRLEQPDGFTEITTAVQPGRRVMTVDRSTGLRTPTLFISPRPSEPLR